jgi:CheY-like chemotaxis protein
LSIRILSALDRAPRDHEKQRILLVERGRFSSTLPDKPSQGLYTPFPAKPRPGVSVSRSGTSILVVDDDADIREALVDVLTDHGYPSQAVAHGAAALAALRGGLRPCIILLDLMMPVMDGLTFRQQQLADPDLKELPVLVISAGNDLSVHAAALGAVETLRKPIDLDKLLEVVARHC